MASFAGLTEVTVDHVARHLKDRFDAEIYCTLASPRDLILVNPASFSQDRSEEGDGEDSEASAEYSEAASAHYWKNGEVAYLSYPHIFGMATVVYQRALWSERSQKVLLSGAASGSGKTECLQMFLYQLSCAPPSGSGKIAGLFNRFITILQAFGASYTIANPKASHHSANVQLYFDTRLHCFTGGRLAIDGFYAKIDRLLKYGMGERSFSVFYQLLPTASDPSMNPRYYQSDLALGKTIKKYRLLNRHSQSRGLLPCDAQDGTILWNAFEYIGWSRHRVRAIIKVLAAILHLSNLSFDLPLTRNNDPVCLMNPHCLDQAGRLLGLDDEGTDRLRALLISEYMDGCTRYLSLSEASERLDHFLMDAYANLFRWIVFKMNEQVSAAEDAISITISTLKELTAMPCTTEMPRISSLSKGLRCSRNTVISEIFSEEARNISENNQNESFDQWTVYCLRPNLTLEPRLLDYRYLANQLQSESAIISVIAGHLGDCFYTEDAFLHQKRFNESFTVRQLSYQKYLELVSNLKPDSDEQPVHDFAGIGFASVSESSRNPSSGSSAETYFEMIERQAEMDLHKSKSTTTTTSSRKLWMEFSRLVTLFIPDWILGRLMKDAEMRQAWREKCAICAIIAGLSGLMIFFITGFTKTICPEQMVRSVEEVRATATKGPLGLFIVHGHVFGVGEAVELHKRGKATPEHIWFYASGRDVSSWFPPPSSLLAYRRTFGRDLQRLFPRKDREKRNITDVSTNYQHSVENLLQLFTLPTIQFLAIDPSMVRAGNCRENALIVIGRSVYNITRILSDPVAFGRLGPSGRDAVEAPWGVDKTAEKISDEDHRVLMDHFIGVLDQRGSLRCRIASSILIGATCLLVLAVTVKFLAALQLGAKRDPEELDRHVILQVPCYTEGEASLRQTIDSLVGLAYEDKRKLLVVICDGMVVGKGNDRSTPQIVLDILQPGTHLTVHGTFSYPSCDDLEAKRPNRALIFSGLYECLGHCVPYLLIIKTGIPDLEHFDRSGNRGKRDSQLIILRFLASLHNSHHESGDELTAEIHHHVRHVIGVDPLCYEYLLMVDADTRVEPDALTRLLACCLHDQRVMGVCGETRISNPRASWVSMLQVYEYYISHHMSKAFESLFGTVTCLPGCFSLYRIWARRGKVDAVEPILASPAILRSYGEDCLDTLHKRNLLCLGEDR